MSNHEYPDLPDTMMMMTTTPKTKMTNPIIETAINRSKTFDATTTFSKSPPQQQSQQQQQQQSSQQLQQQQQQQQPKQRRRRRRKYPIYHAWANEGVDLQPILQAINDSYYEPFIHTSSSSLSSTDPNLYNILESFRPFPLFLVMEQATTTKTITMTTTGGTVPIQQQQQQQQQQHMKKRRKKINHRLHQNDPPNARQLVQLLPENNQDDDNNDNHNSNSSSTTTITTTMENSTITTTITKTTTTTNSPRLYFPVKAHDRMRKVAMGGADRWHIMLREFQSAIQFLQYHTTTITTTTTIMTNTTIPTIPARSTGSGIDGGDKTNNDMNDDNDNNNDTTTVLITTTINNDDNGDDTTTNSIQELFPDLTHLLHQGGILPMMIDIGDYQSCPITTTTTTKMNTDTTTTNTTTNTTEPASPLAMFTLCRSTSCPYGFPIPTYMTFTYAQMGKEDEQQQQQGKEALGLSSASTNTTTTNTTFGNNQTHHHHHHWKTLMSLWAQEYPWHSKQSQVYWRGGIKSWRRVFLHAVQQYHHHRNQQTMNNNNNNNNLHHPEGGGLHNQTNSSSSSSFSFLNVHVMSKHKKDRDAPTESMKYKAVFDIDGNSWSERFTRLLCSNSAVVRIQVGSYVGTDPDTITSMSSHSTANYYYNNNNSGDHDIIPDHLMTDRYGTKLNPHDFEEYYFFEQQQQGEDDDEEEDDKNNNDDDSMSFPSFLSFNSMDTLRPNIHYIPASLSNFTRVAEYILQPEQDVWLQQIVQNANAWCRHHIYPQRLHMDFLSIMNGYVQQLNQYNPQWSSSSKLLSPSSLDDDSNNNNDKASFDPTTTASYYIGKDVHEKGHLGFLSRVTPLPRRKIQRPKRSLV